MTEMVYIDEVEVDEEGIAEMMLDESSIAQVARESYLSFFVLSRLENTPIPNVKKHFFKVLEHHWDSLEQVRVGGPHQPSGTGCQEVVKTSRELAREI